MFFNFYLIFHTTISAFRFQISYFLDVSLRFSEIILFRKVCQKICEFICCSCVCVFECLTSAKSNKIVFFICIIFTSNSFQRIFGSYRGALGKGEEDGDAEFVANIIFFSCVIENVLRKTKTNANSQQILLYTRVNIMIIIITLRVHCCCCCSCC